MQPGEGVVEIPQDQRLLLDQAKLVARPAERQVPLQDRLHRVPQVMSE